jgi:hypothetical protein
VIAIHQVAEDFRFIEGLVVPAGLRAAGDADAVALGQVEEACEAEVNGLPVPHDDVFGGQARCEQAFDDRGGYGGARAAVRPGRGKDFDADDVLRGHQAAPGCHHGGLAGQVGECAVHHRANDGGPGAKSLKRVGLLDSDNARARAGFGERRWGGSQRSPGVGEQAAAKRRQQPARKIASKQCVS